MSDWPNPFAGALSALQGKSRLRSLITLDGQPGAYAIIDGNTYLNCASNNYLDLAHHPALAEAASRAAFEGGVGATGARLLGGTTPWHRSLENALCRFRPMHSQAGEGKTLLFNTGYMANLGLIRTLAPALGPVFSDHDNHASTVDGLLSMKGDAGGIRSFQRYRHLDMTHLESLLKSSKDRSDANPGLVASETLFSMNGDIAPLRDLFALQRRFGFWLLFDEAHSTLCMPDLLEPFLHDEGADLSRTLIMGSFGKAFGGFGAYVCGPAPALDFLVQYCRPFLFSTALPPPVLAAAEAALQVAAAEPERAQKLASVSQALRTALTQEGFDLCGSQSHIVPVLIGDDAMALAASHSLREAGIHAPAIRPPTVPEGKCRLRISMTSAFGLGEVARLTEALKQARSRLASPTQVAG